MAPSKSQTDDKLLILAEAYGLSVDELLAEYGLDSVVPGICMNPDCDYSTEYDPDQEVGWCDVCGTATVKSFLLLLGLI
jgi:hypothetical protein